MGLLIEASKDYSPAGFSDSQIGELKRTLCELQPNLFFGEFSLGQPRLVDNYTFKFWLLKSSEFKDTNEWVTLNAGGTLSCITCNSNAMLLRSGRMLSR